MQRTVSDPVYAGDPHAVSGSAHSAVSWGAVIAGAVIAAALSATLITGGAGLGFLAISPWQNDGASGPVITTGTVVWLLLSHIVAYGIAGYVTGRLRTKWTDAMRDEIYFRDTAHGFLVWALSFVVGLVLLGSTVASVISGTAKAGASLAGAGAGAITATLGESAGDDGGFSIDYFADTLLRPAEPGSTDQADVRREVALILSRSVAQGELSDDDQAYLVRIVSQRAGISEAQAQERLNQITTQARQTAEEVELKARDLADEARKAAATFSLWAFASLLIGAFVASFAATVGGRARDM